MQPLGEAIGNRLGPLDRVEEVFAETFLDDLLGGHGSRLGRHHCFERPAGARRPHGRRHRHRHIFAWTAVGILTTRQLGNLVEEMDFADDDADLGILIVLTAAIRHADVALEAHRLLVLRERAHIEGPPGKTTRQVRDLDRHLATDLAADIPQAQILHARRIHQLGDVDLAGVVLGQHLQAGRVDECIGPGELQGVGPFLEC